MFSYLLKLFLLITFCLELSAIEEQKLDSLEGGVNFLVMGDWGRRGDYFQKDVAKAMADVSAKLNSGFIISTGDNFYQAGVQNTEDSHWKESFEDIYHYKSLQKRWVVTLGNHDYQGNSQAEIDYTKKSDRWYMPQRYFTYEIKINNKIIKFICIDTSPFIKDYYTEKKYAKNIGEQDTNSQKKWFDSVMTNSTADLNIVVGHHPPLSSSSKHGGASAIKNLLAKYNSKIKYTFWGHEHDMQHQLEHGFPNVFISGAGSECRPSGKNDATHFALGETGGFASVSINNTYFLLQFLDYKGNIVYTFKEKY